MSLLNDPTLSSLGIRIRDLMLEKGFDTPRKLATELYDHRHIEVNHQNRKTLEQKMDARDKAIAAITRNLQKFMHEEDERKLPSDYALAMAELFECSTDWLYGRTEYRSENMVLQDITEITGLELEAVLNLNVCLTNDQKWVCSYWNDLLSSDAFFDIPNDYSRAAKEGIEHIDQYFARERCIRLLEEETDPEQREELEQSIEGLDIQMQRSDRTYQGLLETSTNGLLEFNTQRIHALLEDHMEIAKLMFLHTFMEQDEENDQQSKTDEEEKDEDKIDQETSNEQ